MNKNKDIFLVENKDFLNGRESHGSVQEARQRFWRQLLQ